jgi:predicted polyphosphate/ATP-dependent NAD kinase
LRRETGGVQKRRLGLIVNPIAGMGGRVGLKGTDGADTVREALLRGASPGSPRRAADALRVILRIRDRIDLITYPLEMGESEAREAGFSPNVMGQIETGRTTSEDTLRAARDMKGMGVDLLLFVGGDGTARDIYRAVGQEVTVLGVPSGVKMHSGVFAITPRRAGEVAVASLMAERPRLTEAEVMDIDEVSFRRGVVAAKLYGYLRIPEERSSIQSVKSGGSQTEVQAHRGIATEIIRDMEEGCLYIFGPGTTTRDILAQLHIEKTLLGVDLVLDRRLIAADVSERRLAELTARRRAKMVITVIGGQGYIFGRGNQQLSPGIIRRVGRKNLIVVATKQKLASLGGRPLLVDTGDETVDRLLDGYVRVVTGLGDYVMYRIGS